MQTTGWYWVINREAGRSERLCVLRVKSSKVTIVEHKDATDSVRSGEINTGILIANGADMKTLVVWLTNNNAQGEYYITDIIALAYQEGREIAAVRQLASAKRTRE